ncbi:MAG TPA: hypothetical protein PK335_07345 [Draconibacterium sp.]|nr:hypothetical protein [Draconibacterium sp.]
MNRKKFIQSGGRFLLLGGLATISGYLVWNRKVTTTCSVSPACSNCGKFESCQLPQAEEVRNGK